MDNIDYKSKLQIILQKSKNNLPIYDTHYVENESDYKFQSVLTFTFNDTIRTEKDKNQLFLSKQKAEQHIAHLGILFIEKLRSEKFIINKKIFEKFTDVHILIDYENFNNNDEIDLLKKNNHLDNFYVTKYASSHNAIADFADIVVNSTRHDACDVKICCETSRIFLSFDNPLVIIITKDNFASCLGDIYENCYHLPNIIDCVNKINSFF